MGELVNMMVFWFNRTTMILRKQAALEKIGGKHAILVLEDGQELAVLKDELGKELSLGDRFTIQIQPVSEAELTQVNLARTLLNQILDNETSAHT